MKDMHQPHHPDNSGGALDQTTPKVEITFEGLVTLMENAAPHRGVSFVTEWFLDTLAGLDDEVLFQFLVETKKRLVEK